MKTMTQTEIIAAAQSADAAAKTCYAEVQRLIRAAKHERSRRSRAGVNAGEVDDVIQRLSDIRETIDRLGLGSRLNAFRCETIVAMLADGWEL